MRNWYEIFGLPEDVTEAELLRQRELARIAHHPDRRGKDSQELKDWHAARLATYLDGVAFLLHRENRRRLDAYLMEQRAAMDQAGAAAAEDAEAAARAEAVRKQNEKEAKERGDSDTIWPTFDGGPRGTTGANATGGGSPPPPRVRPPPSPPSPPRPSPHQPPQPRSNPPPSPASSRPSRATTPSRSIPPRRPTPGRVPAGAMARREVSGALLRRTSLAVLVGLAIVVVVAKTWRFGSSTSAAPVAPLVSKPAPPKSDVGCTAIGPPVREGPRRVPKPTALLDSSKSYFVRLSTNCGEVTIALDVANWPVTASSFAWLVQHRFYDGLTFDGVSVDTISGGYPPEEGVVGAGYTVFEPPPPASVRYSYGVVGMWGVDKRPAGTSASGFFIVTYDYTLPNDLPRDYPIVGYVVGNDAAVQAIEFMPTSSLDSPAFPVIIEKAVLITQ
jgi:cyclophilin family peptidyl-prolyl cis-trans isomerase